MLYRHILATTALTLLAQPSLAQDLATPGQPYILPAITLTANQTEEELSRSGATVEVADTPQLQQSGKPRAADFLATLPGVSVTTNGGFGTSTDLRIRGLGGQYVKVLYDGIDISDSSNPQISLNWGSVLTGNLSRIEVLKGPQSALYGSEAIAGVVSIFTMPDDQPGTHQQAGFELGSYGTSAARYGIAHNTERGGLAFSAQHFETDGFSTADENDGNTEADGANSTLASLSGHYKLTDQITIGAAALWQKTDVQTDGDFPVLADNADASHSIRRGARVYAEYDGGAMQHRLSLQASETDRRETYGTFAYPFTGSRQELAYDGSTELAGGSLAWGAVHSKETFAEGGDDLGYITNSLFAEYRRALSPDLDLSLSARRDHNSQFGNSNTGRLALSWRPAEGWTIRTQIGSGYRAPSPYELYNPFAGNPDLHPEKSLGYEAGIERQWANGAALRLSAFHNEVEDLIINNATTGFVYLQTQGTSRIRGVEIAGETPLTDRLTLAGNFTFTDTEGADGQPLPRVPRQALNLRLDGDITDRSRFGLSLQHNAGLMDDAVEMPSYTVIGASVEYDLTDQAIGYVRVENLLDEEYQVLQGYGTSDRAIYAGIRADF